MFQDPFFPEAGKLERFFRGTWRWNPLPYDVPGPLFQIKAEKMAVKILLSGKNGYIANSLEIKVHFDLGRARNIRRRLLRAMRLNFYDRACGFIPRYKEYVREIVKELSERKKGFFVRSRLSEREWHRCTIHQDFFSTLQHFESP